MANDVHQLRAAWSRVAAACGLPQQYADSFAQVLRAWSVAAASEAQRQSLARSFEGLGLLVHRASEPAAVALALGLRCVAARPGVPEADLSRAATGLATQICADFPHSAHTAWLSGVPGASTVWMPPDGDAELLSDLERLWFGDPAPAYRQHADAQACGSAGLPCEHRQRARLKALGQIVDSGTIYFTPECRSELEGRAFLNLSLEIAAWRSKLERRAHMGC